MKLKAKNKKLPIILLSAVAAAALVCAAKAAQPLNVLAESGDLLYSLDFSDRSDIGKNAVGGFADAVLPDGSALSVTDGLKGKNALEFVGGTDMQNYLSLPTDMFEGKTAVTLSGWFYLPSGVEAYLGEIGIYSADNDVAFRTDPYASYHDNAYIMCAGNPDTIDLRTGVKPVYDAWYHMAYVIDGNAHMFYVYQNGALVYEKELAAEFTPSQYYSQTSHFYLGQSSYTGYHGEGGHNDYKGKMSDFRVYGAALGADEIKTEYGLEITDFKTAEYTFDVDSPATDGVRGYDLADFNKAATYADGVMSLADGAAVQAYNKTNGLNVNFFDGHANMTISMDIRISTPPATYWRRIMDMYAGSNNRITYMAYCPRTGTFLDAVYAKDGDNNMLGDNSFQPKNGEWFNLTFVLSGNEISVYEDGVLKVTGNTGDKPSFASFVFDLANSGEGNFTIGTCSYEPNNYIDADYDNIRIYAAAAKDADEVRSARAGYACYSLRYEANDGSGEYREIFAEKNSDVQIADCPFVKNGYAFGGWNGMADGSGTAYSAGETLNIGGDTVLYAMWQINSYTVTFDANGGRGEMPVQVVDFGTVREINGCAFVRTGYSFAGWNTSPDGTGAAYSDGQQLDLSSDITLYAEWTAKQYTVTFDANGGSGEMQPQILTYDAESALNKNSFARHGYVFAGWALTPTGVAVYENGQSVTGIEEGEDITLYAVWVVGKFTVAFDANGGTGEMQSLVADAFSYVTLPENAFTCADKSFVGWATETDGEAVYNDCAYLALDGNLTLYAVWESVSPVEPSQPSVPPEEPIEKDGLTGLQIAAIVAGCVVFAGAVTAAVIVIIKKKK